MRSVLTVDTLTKASPQDATTGAQRSSPTVQDGKIIPRLRKVLTLMVVAGAAGFATTAIASAAPRTTSVSRATSGAIVIPGLHVVKIAASAVRPAIGQASCTSSRSTWVRLYLTNGNTTCFGWKGTTGYLAYTTFLLWPGNNYGWVRFNYGYRNYNLKFGQWPGSATYLYYDWDYPPYFYAIVNYITIDGWWRY